MFTGVTSVLSHAISALRLVVDFLFGLEEVVIAVMGNSEVASAESQRVFTSLVIEVWRFFNVFIRLVIAILNNENVREYHGKRIRQNSAVLVCLCFSDFDSCILQCLKLVRGSQVISPQPLHPLAGFIQLHQ